MDLPERKRREVERKLRTIFNKVKSAQDHLNKLARISPSYKDPARVEVLLRRTAGRSKTMYTRTEEQNLDTSPKELVKIYYANATKDEQRQHRIGFQTARDQRKKREKKKKHLP